MDTLPINIFSHLLSYTNDESKTFGVLLRVSKGWKEMTLKYGRLLYNNLVSKYIPKEDQNSFTKVKEFLIRRIMGEIPEATDSIHIYFWSGSRKYDIGFIAPYSGWGETKKTWTSVVLETQYEIDDDKTRAKLAMSRDAFHKGFETKTRGAKHTLYTMVALVGCMIKFLIEDPYVEDLEIVCISPKFTRIFDMRQEFNKHIGFKYWVPEFYQTFQYSLENA